MALTKFYRSVEVTLTPEEVARAFADLASDQMAAFFTEVHRIIKDEYSNGMVGFDYQLSWATQPEVCTPEGREVMRSIGSFADPIPAE